jgi:hypothetical protein
MLLLLHHTISTAAETHKGFRVQSRVEITENENTITRVQE